MTLVVVIARGLWHLFLWLSVVCDTAFPHSLWSVCHGSDFYSRLSAGCPKHLRCFLGCPHRRNFKWPAHITSPLKTRLKVLILKSLVWQMVKCLKQNYTCSLLHYERLLKTQLLHRTPSLLHHGMQHIGHGNFTYTTVNLRLPSTDLISCHWLYNCLEAKESNCFFLALEMWRRREDSSAITVAIVGQAGWRPCWRHD